MKRSKIFLGVTACFLAIAGVAAVKRFGPSKTRLYCTVTHDPGYCVATTELFVFTKSSNTNCVTIVVPDGAGFPISRIVYTLGTINTRCTGTNCIHCLIKQGN